MMARPATQAIRPCIGPWWMSPEMPDVGDATGFCLRLAYMRTSNPLLRLHFGNRKVMECQEGNEFLMVFARFCAPQATNPSREADFVWFRQCVRLAVLNKQWLQVDAH